MVSEYPGFAAAPTLFRPKFEKSPMKPWNEGPNASVYPHKAHTRLTTANLPDSEDELSPDGLSRQAGEPRDPRDHLESRFLRDTSGLPVMAREPLRQHHRIMGRVL